MKLIFCALFLFPVSGFCQTDVNDVEQLKQQVISLQRDVADIQINLSQSQNKFKSGILVATIGYTVTIAGGLMLGRKNDDLGKVLLISGGVTGVTGTILMVDAFKYLGRVGKRKPK